MKPVHRTLSPETKAAFTQSAEAWARKSKAMGYDIGWKRGFRVGALLSAAVLSTAGLLIAGIAWVVG